MEDERQMKKKTVQFIGGLRRMKKNRGVIIHKWTLLHWYEEAVRTWDEHATSAAVSSPIGHMIRMLSLLQCFHQYNTRWVYFLCSSVVTNRTEDEDAISAVVFFTDRTQDEDVIQPAVFSPVEHKMMILSLCNVLSSRTQDEEAVLASVSSSVSTRVHRFKIL